MFDTIRKHTNQPNQLPNYRHAKRLLAQASSVKKELFANDCFMKLLDESMENDACPLCNAGLLDGKGRAKKVFHYLGVSERLRDMLEDPRLYPLLALPPPPDSPPELGRARNIWESVRWHESVHQGRGRQGSAETDYGVANDRHNIALSLNMDGFNPWRSSTYSMTPMNLMVLNLPENLRHKPEYMIMAGLIPGRMQPRSYHIYLNLLVDELLMLFNSGFIYTRPAIGDQPAQEQVCKVKLLNTSADYPAHSKINCQQDAGATFGCMKCEIQGMRRFNRACYDGYKSFGMHDITPRRRTHADVVIAASKAKVAWKETWRKWRDEEHEPGSVPSKIKTLPEWKGVSGEIPLLRLPYFDIVRDTLPDMMHITSGVLQQHLIPLLKGDRLKKLKQNEDADKKRKEQEAARLRQRAAAELETHTQRMHQQRLSDILRSAISRPDPRRSRIRPLVLDDEEETEGEIEEEEEDEEEEKEIQPAAAAASVPSVSDMQGRWRNMEKDYTLLESKCLNELQAPSGLIGGKLPFSRTGEMTAHHWVNFAKVYGSYLFAQHYNGPSLALLCDILKLLRLCLSSVITPQLIQEARETAKGLAIWFDKFLPATEKAIIFHLLIFHIPSIIEQWGPARNFWCFPFERMIGVLAHSASQPKDPEKMIVNRYLQTIATSRSDIVLRSQNLESQLLVRGDHPLVPIDAIHSRADRHKVFFPKLTKNNSRFESISNSHIRDMWLKPLFGKVVSDAHRHQPSLLQVRTYTIAMQIGLWKYRCKDAEDGRQVFRARASWFRIKAKKCTTLCRTST